MKQKIALVVGGSNGIGLALTQQLLMQGYGKVIVADREKPKTADVRIEYLKINLINCDYDIFDEYQYVNTLIITAGFGRIAEFEKITETEILNGFKVNAISAISIIKKYYNQLRSDDNFNCVVMGSIAGWICSPLFSVYSATKASLCKFIEAINVELEKEETQNRVLNVSPGSLRGTRFNGGENDVSLLSELAETIIKKMEQKCELFIPDYDEIYQNVMNKYIENPHKFGLESYDYKIKSSRVNLRPQVKTGYLTGTFDLFHIGHLNLLRKAKQYCDYLIVGVHKDASHKGKTAYVPFEERVEILKSVKYVDKVVPSLPEDTDAYEELKYDYLFVGSDYKGTERFAKYEAFFNNKDVQIIYFPYTKGTSSTKIREIIDKQLNEATIVEESK